MNIVAYRKTILCRFSREKNSPFQCHKIFNLMFFNKSMLINLIMKYFG